MELQTITIINISEDPIHKGADNSEDNDEILLTGTENKRRASRKKPETLFENIKCRIKQTEKIDEYLKWKR